MTRPFTVLVRKCGQHGRVLTAASIFGSLQASHQHFGFEIVCGPTLQHLCIYSNINILNIISIVFITLCTSVYVVRCETYGTETFIVLLCTYQYVGVYCTVVPGADRIEGRTA